METKNKPAIVFLTAAVLLANDLGQTRCRY